MKLHKINFKSIIQNPFKSNLKKINKIKMNYKITKLNTKIFKNNLDKTFYKSIIKLKNRKNNFKIKGIKSNKLNKSYDIKIKTNTNNNINIVLLDSKVFNKSKPIYIPKKVKYTLKVGYFKLKTIIK